MIKENMTEYLESVSNNLDEETIRALAHHFKDKKTIMLGEATHGTHEYYLWREKISRVLLEEYGFDFVAVEGDWPACYQINRNIKSYTGNKRTCKGVLQNFDRWPRWMWANEEVLGWCNWAKQLNSSLSPEKQKGFYGLDVYSLYESLDSIIAYLEKEDPPALEDAMKAMLCFEPYRSGDGQKYAYSTSLVPEGCKNEVLKLLRQITDRKSEYSADREHAFSTEQNAFVAKNAEEYYRQMMKGGNNTWNLRDKHMMDTLHRLLEFHGPEAKAIVWAHNTHVGDARYTDMVHDGMFNIGELARKQYGEDAVALIGFGSYEGTVLAGQSWGAKAEVMDLPKARAGSWEDKLHPLGDCLFYSDDLREYDKLRYPIDHRAVGVVYHPQREAWGNYVPTIIPDRYDAFIFIDETKALEELLMR